MEIECKCDNYPCTCNRFMKMEKEFNLKKERKMIPKIINITNAVAYHTGAW